MSDTSHVAFVGDRERTLALTPLMIVELERVTGAGIGGLFKRMCAGTFSLAEIVETVRLALIGGGETPENASTLVRVYVAPQPLADTYSLALDVLSAVYFGKASRPVKEPAP
jgi:hypothetical protein